MVVKVRYPNGHVGAAPAEVAQTLEQRGQAVIVKETNQAPDGGTSTTNDKRQKTGDTNALPAEK